MQLAAARIMFTRAHYSSYPILLYTLAGPTSPPGAKAAYATLRRLSSPSFLPYEAKVHSALGRGQDARAHARISLTSRTDYQTLCRPAPRSNWPDGPRLGTVI